jgi:hypothetical protein
VAKKQPLESEGFHNQTLTEGAARVTERASAKPAKKVVALQLDAREYAAFRWLGGGEALKKLLCPADLCLRCRSRPPQSGTFLDSLCHTCEREHEAAQS